MKKLLVCSVLMVFLALSSQAQVLLVDINGVPYTDRNTADLGGSPFFNDEFLKGSITLDDKSVFKDIFLRYDLESDQLVYRKSSTSGSMLPNGKVIGFTIEQPNGMSANFKGVFKGDDKDGFYQLLLEGNNSLLKKVKKKVVEVVEYNSSSKNKTMSTMTSYFIQKPTGDIELVKSDKKSFIKVFGRESEINDFISKQNINLKNESDMIKLVAYINSIEKSI
jgi:hypothetical protein